MAGVRAHRAGTPADRLRVRRLHEAHAPLSPAQPLLPLFFFPAHLLPLFFSIPLKRSPSLPAAVTLESEILERIRPTPAEQSALEARVARITQILCERIRERGLSAEPLLVGSVAKGTHLTANEVDLFVLFPEETPRETLEKEGLALGTFLDRREKMFAEHPYTHGYFEGLAVEIVPGYKIVDSSKKMSAVDRTPFHARYVSDRLTGAGRDQVRLLKAFCKGTGTYGAEARVQGFSGYLCELLGLKYGSFQAVLEAAREWRAGTRLELDRAATRSFPEPLIFV